MMKQYINGNALPDAGGAPGTEPRRGNAGNGATDAEILYADIINMPHHVSENHPRMSAEARGAQFAPFAALGGFSEMTDTVAAEVASSEESPDAARITPAGSCRGTPEKGRG